MPARPPAGPRAACPTQTIARSSTLPDVATTSIRLTASTSGCAPASSSDPYEARPVAKTELSVGAAEAGLRLDRFLLAAHAGLSRRALALCFAAARVTLNGRPARKGDRVH